MAIWEVGESIHADNNDDDGNVTPMWAAPLVAPKCPTQNNAFLVGRFSNVLLFFDRNEEEFLASARFSLTESIDLRERSGDFDTSFEASIMSVSSVVGNAENRQTEPSLQGDAKSNPQGKEPGNPPEVAVETLSCVEESQPEVDISSTSARASDTGPGEGEEDITRLPLNMDKSVNKSKKRKRATHKDIKSRVKAMIHKGKLKLSESAGKKKKKSNVTMDGTFKNKKTMATANDETEHLPQGTKDVAELRTVQETDIKISVKVGEETSNNKGEETMTLENVAEILQSSEVLRNEPEERKEAEGTEHTGKNEQEIQEEPTVESLEATTRTEEKPDAIDNSNAQSFAKPNDLEGTENEATDANKDPSVVDENCDKLLDTELTEDVKQLQRRYSSRRRWKKASRPDFRNLVTQDSLSLAESLESATYLSSYGADGIQEDEELEPEIIEEIRLNKTKWKRVVAQIKEQHTVNDSEENNETVTGEEIAVNTLEERNEEVEVKKDLTHGDVSSEMAVNTGPDETLQNQEAETSHSQLVEEDEKCSDKHKEAANVTEEISGKEKRKANSRSLRFLPFGDKSKEKATRKTPKDKKEKKTREGKTKGSKRSKEKSEQTPSSEGKEPPNKENPQAPKTGQEHSEQETKAETETSEVHAEQSKTAITDADGHNAESTPAKQKQPKEKSPKKSHSSQSMNLLRQDHSSVMQILASRTLVRFFSFSIISNPSNFPAGATFLCWMRIRFLLNAYLS